MNDSTEKVAYVFADPRAIVISERVGYVAIEITDVAGGAHSFEYEDETRADSATADLSALRDEHRQTLWRLNDADNEIADLKEELAVLTENHNRTAEQLANTIRANKETR